MFDSPYPHTNGRVVIAPVLKTVVLLVGGSNPPLSFLNSVGRPFRLMARTSDFLSENAGSIPAKAEFKY